MKTSFFVAAAFVLGCATSAQAGCVIAPGVHFFPEQNDSVTYHVEVTKGGCGTQYRAGGQATFTSASVLQGPQEGTLRQLGPMKFHYDPKPGYKGPDKYAIKVCGRGLAGSGCSSVHYEAAVD